MKSVRVVVERKGYNGYFEVLTSSSMLGSVIDKVVTAGHHITEIHPGEEDCYLVFSEVELKSLPGAPKAKKKKSK